MPFLIFCRFCKFLCIFSSMQCMFHSKEKKRNKIAQNEGCTDSHDKKLCKPILKPNKKLPWFNKIIKCLALFCFVAPTLVWFFSNKFQRLGDSFFLLYLSPLPLLMLLISAPFPLPPAPAHLIEQTGVTREGLCLAAYQAVRDHGIWSNKQIPFVEFSLCLAPKLTTASFLVLVQG